MGVDTIWFLPIHPIGEKGKKGTLGCPYANRDYREVNPAYGEFKDFKHLIDAIHEYGMKCMIDVVNILISGSPSGSPASSRLSITELTVSISFISSDIVALLFYQGRSFSLE